MIETLLVSFILRETSESNQNKKSLTLQTSSRNLTQRKCPSAEAKWRAVLPS